MRVLFLHQNFPGQFRHVASALQQQPGNQLLALVPAGHTGPKIIRTRGVSVRPKAGTHELPAGRTLYRPRRPRRGRSRGDAQAARRRLCAGSGHRPLRLGRNAVRPRRLAGLPDTSHAEFFYRAQDSDVDFDPEFPPPDVESLRLEMRTRNSTTIIGLLDADRGITPTAWQASLFPEKLRTNITVLHEGIDTDVIRPSPAASVALDASGLELRPGDEVVTFVNRDLEPYRGYHIFMRALPRILERRPKARAIIVGGNGVSYGPPPSRQELAEVFLPRCATGSTCRGCTSSGRVPHPRSLELMQVSAAHVYLTYPFVLSWSMLEAISAGALRRRLRTPPVEEIITHGTNGILGATSST